MTDTPEKPAADKSDKLNWTGKAAIAGAAIGSAALAAALLYASRRRENAEAKAKALPAPTPAKKPDTAEAD